METATLNETDALATQREVHVHLPLGLLGFERMKWYHLIARPDEAPFRWLQVADDPALAFLLLSPFEVVAHYQPDIPAEDVAFLELATPADAFILNIVTLHQRGPSTVNLKGPIVFNRSTLIGKQIVPVNAPEFPLRYPLPIADAH